ncbi:MAG: hypothetical protein WA252_01380 [Candidatus Sulfotelmatobacter sp.]
MDGQPASIDQPRLASGHDRGIGSIGRSAERQIGGTADRLNVGPQGVRLPIASPDTRH